MHEVADIGGVGQACGDDVPRRDLDSADGDLGRRIEPQQVNRLQHCDELVTEAVLERHPVGVDPARHEDDLLVLDVHALDRADAGRELEHLGLAEGLGREPAAVFFPDDRRIQAFLDRGPDGESGTEGVTVDDEVGAVPDSELVDRGEQVVRRIACEHVRQARLDSHADECQSATLLPLRSKLELFVSELDPGSRVRRLRIRMRERHSHVDVGDACSKGRPIDRHHEARIDRVQYRVAALGLQHVANGGLVGGVDPGSAEVVGGGPRRPFGARQVVVGDHHVLEAAPAGRDACERASNPTCPYDEHTHRATPLSPSTLDEQARLSSGSRCA